MCNNIKISDFIKDSKIDCDRIIPELKKVVSFAMPYIYQLPWFAAREEIDPTVNTKKTEFNVFRINWRYWEVCDACVDCFDIEENCSTCCDEWYWKIRMMDISPRRKSRSGQYFMECPMSNTISYSIPTWIKSAYISYYKRPKIGDDINWEVEIPEYLFWAMNILLKYFTTNDWTENKYKLDFIDIITKLQETYPRATPRTMKAANTQNFWGTNRRNYSLIN